MALKRDGSLWELGFGVPRRIGVDNDWLDFFSERPEGLAGGIKADGSLWTWWSGPDESSEPVRLGTDNDWSVAAGGFWSGQFNTFAVKADGSLWTALLGGVVRFDQANNWLAVASGSQFFTEAGFGTLTLALRTNGSLWSYKTVPLGPLPEAFSRVGLDCDRIAISVGRLQGVALKADGWDFVKKFTN